MDLYIIGQMIREFRTRKFISQEDLCDGLCAISTLSRIENGKQLPKQKLTEALLSRMGIAHQSSNVPMTNTEIRRLDIEYTMRQKLVSNDYEIRELLDEYKNLGDMDNLEQQSYRMFSALFESFHNVDKNILLSHFTESLKLTLPEFKNVQDLKNRLLTQTELLILNNISVTEYELDNKNEAIMLMEFLKDYYESHSLEQSEIGVNLPVILFNLSNWYGQANKIEEGLKISECGIDVCSKYSKLAHFFRFIFNKGYFLGKLGKINECRENILLAFKIMKTMKNYTEIQLLIPQINSEFNLDFKVEDFLPPNY